MEISNKCLDIFYNHILNEVQKGRVDCYFMYNIIFNVQIENNPPQLATKEYQGLIIPTLQIKNKLEFDQLLIEYVQQCLDFYSNNNYPEEILNSEPNNLTKGISPEKTIMTLLFANATMDDFANPNDFLRRRINFFKESQSAKYHLGYSNILQGNLTIEIAPDSINNETPYQFKIKATSLDGEAYNFPSIKFGISDNKLYIYAIQNNVNNSNSYSKKVKRNLYKIGEGFDSKKDNFDLYQEGNLQDITPSFIVAINILIAYFYQLGIQDIVVSSILLPRWNSKKIATQIRQKSGKLSTEQINSLEAEQLRIQSNLTEKLLRSFLRLQHHYNGLETTAYPFQIDSNLHLIIHQLDSCNNQLLSETRNLVIQNIPKENKKMF